MPVLSSLFLKKHDEGTDFVGWLRAVNRQFGPGPCAVALNGKALFPLTGNKLVFTRIRHFTQCRLHKRVCYHPGFSGPDLNRLYPAGDTVDANIVRCIDIAFPAGCLR